MGLSIRVPMAVPKKWSVGGRDQGTGALADQQSAILPHSCQALMSSLAATRAWVTSV